MSGSVVPQTETEERGAVLVPPFSGKTELLGDAFRGFEFMCFF